MPIRKESRNWRHQEAVGLPVHIEELTNLQQQTPTCTCTFADQSNINRNPPSSPILTTAMARLPSGYEEGGTRRNGTAEYHTKLTKYTRQFRPALNAIDYSCRGCGGLISIRGYEKGKIRSSSLKRGSKHLRRPVSFPRPIYKEPIRSIKSRSPQVSITSEFNSGVSKRERCMRSYQEFVWPSPGSIIPPVPESKIGTKTLAVCAISWSYLTCRLASLPGARTYAPLLILT